LLIFTSNPKYSSLLWSIEYIKQLCLKSTTFSAGNSLSTGDKLQQLRKSERSVWGSVAGSGPHPYLVFVDLVHPSIKCNCPSRQFPCKHGIAVIIRYVNDPVAFLKESEPEEVKNWIENRSKKTTYSQSEEKDITEEFLAKKQKQAEKTAQNRQDSVSAGIDELMLWMKDHIRLGMLDFPTKPAGYFEKFASRMIDAKAPGLAGWIRAYRDLNYSDKQMWQKGVLEITAKTYLLCKAFHNLDNFEPELKETIKSLVGWTINSKMMLTDESTITVKDHWLVLGKTTEMQEDLTIHRTWFFGLESGLDAMHLQFEVKHGNTDIIQYIQGMTIEAEMAFFPDAAPHRSLIKKQNKTLEKIPSYPDFCNDWMVQHDRKIELLKQNPWTNNRAFLIAHCKLFKSKEGWVLYDTNLYFRPIVPSFPVDKLIRLFLQTFDQGIDIAIVDKKEGIYPLGLFINGQYTAL